MNSTLSVADDLSVRGRQHIDRLFRLSVDASPSTISHSRAFRLTSAQARNAVPHCRQTAPAPFGDEPCHAGSLCSLSPGCRVSGAYAGNAPQGQTQELSLPVAGATRWTTVYQPPGYRSGAPVVVLLHGGGMSMRKTFSANAGGMRQWLYIADREKFLLLIPNATNGKTGDPKGDRQNWNDLREASATGKAAADDVGFLMQLLDWAQEKYQIDPRRVFVTGASNGGMMTFRLLLEQPRRFAAAAAYIASLPATAPPKPAATTRVPLMLFNGTRDPLIQWQGGEIRGERGTTMAIEPMVQWWREVNGVSHVRRPTPTACRTATPKTAAVSTAPSGMPKHPAPHRWCFIVPRAAAMPCPPSPIHCAWARSCAA